MNYHFVYALYSKKYNKIYIGQTSNIKARLMSHYYTGHKGYTIRFRPWKLVFLEKYDSLADSIIREKQLKSARGRDMIWKLIQSKY